MSGAGTARQDLPYRQGVGIMLLNRAGEVFAAQRLDTHAEAWQMPQGGMDPGETAEEAALRELEEETGVTSVEILAESADWYRYDLPDKIRAKVWGGRFRGQEQKWFAMRFLGEDSEIVIDREHAEFSEWRWVPMKDLPSLIVPFKMPLYTALVNEFGHLAKPAT